MDEPSPRLPYEGALTRSNGAEIGSENRAAIGESGSMTAGPGVRISLRIDDELCVAEACFETCAFDAARAPASRVCGAMLGCTIDQVSSMSTIDVGLLAGLPPRNPTVRTIHFAKSAALLPWLGRRALAGAQITCTCFRVETDTIRRAIRERRLRTIDDVKDATKASTGCGSCVPDVLKLLEEAARTPDAGK